MRCFIAVILAIVLVAAEAKVVPASDNQETSSTSTPQLADYIRGIQDTFSSWTTQMQEHLNLPNQEEVTNSLANNIRSYIQNMTEEVKAKTPELETLWTNMKSKLSEAVDTLNSPETTEQVNQLRAKFNDTVLTIIEESEKITKTIDENSSTMQEDFVKFTKQALETAVQATQNLHTHLQQAATAQPQS